MKKKGYLVNLSTATYSCLYRTLKICRGKTTKSVAELRPAPCVARKLYGLMAKGQSFTNYVYEFGVLFGCVGVRVETVGNSNSNLFHHLKLGENPGQDTRSPEDLGGWTGKATSHNRGKGPRHGGRWRWWRHLLDPVASRCFFMRCCGGKLRNTRPNDASLRRYESRESWSQWTTPRLVDDEFEGYTTHWTHCIWDSHHPWTRNPDEPSSMDPAISQKNLPGEDTDPEWVEEQGCGDAAAGGNAAVEKKSGVTLGVLIKASSNFMSWCVLFRRFVYCTLPGEFFRGTSR